MKNSRIDNFLDGIAKMFVRMGSVNFWPANVPQMDSSYNDILAKDLYLAIEKLKKNKTKKGVAKLFNSPIVILYLLYNPLIIGLKVVKRYKTLPISSVDIVKFINYLLDVLERKNSGDIFCLDGTNLVLPNTEIFKIAKYGLFLKADSRDLKEELSAFNMDLQSLIWAVCFDALVGYGMEIHGPYNVSRFFGPKSVLIIRDFFDFKQPLWGLDLGFNKVRVMNIYQDVEFEFDMANHFTTNKPLVENLTHWLVSVDDEQINFKEIQKITSQINKLRKKQVKFVNLLRPVEIIEKSAEINYYTLRKVWEVVGMKDWRFSMLKVKKRIKEEGLKYWEQFQDQKFQPSSYYRKLFDPRIDFPIL